MMQGVLATLGLRFEFFPAIDGKCGEDPVLSRYNEETCSRAWRRPLSYGEVGCFASHFRLWQLCVARNEPIIVMEDDVQPSPQFVEAASLAATALPDHGYIRLAGVNCPRFRLVAPAATGWKLVRFLRGPLGTQCYALHPRAAMRLLQRAPEWQVPVDAYMDSFWVHDVPSISLLPFTVWQPQGIGSEIRTMGGFRNPVRKWQRIAVRLKDEALRIKWNLAFAAGAGRFPP